MDTVFDFRPDDKRAVDDILETHSRCAGRAIRLTDLVARWCRFVDELQGGYRGSRLDYEADLAVRATLVEIEECLSVHGRQRLLADLITADRRFLALTVPTRGVWTWKWWQRVPPGWVEAPVGVTAGNQAAAGT